jgi:hypothetical protein
MTEPRVRSKVRQIKGVPSDTNPSHTGFTTPRSPNGHRDGYGMGRGSGEEQPPLTVRRAREFQFVRSHLPEEHEGFAVSALISLQMRGRKPTKQQVLDRLAAQGRRSDQLREKGWMQ